MKYLIFLSVILFSSSAFADVNKIHNKMDQGNDKGYGYEFDDDPLNAGGFGINDAVIKVRPKAARTTLIRPRTSFVPELLKSVQDL